MITAQLGLIGLGLMIIISTTYSQVNSVAASFIIFIKKEKKPLIDAQ